MKGYGLGAQAGSAAGTTASKDLAAVAGAHALAKAVLYCTLALLGMISRLHCNLPLAIMKILQGAALQHRSINDEAGKCQG